MASLTEGEVLEDCKPLPKFHQEMEQDVDGKAESDDDANSENAYQQFDDGIAFLFFREHCKLQMEW